MPESHVYRAYGIYLLQSQHRLMRQLRRVHEPSVHGHKTWDSSFILMDYLIEHPLRRGTRVMEVGCGWGPASVFCATRFGAKSPGSISIRTCSRFSMCWLRSTTWRSRRCRAALKS
ncbi:MAG: hypothetical protein HC809_13880 [Gammaproteobacteria bacterium]|nr:hypothetical protein [Gammaproteobacteria bacterium]